MEINLPPGQKKVVFAIRKLSEVRSKAKHAGDRKRLRLALRLTASSIISPTSRKREL